MFGGNSARALPCVDWVSDQLNLVSSFSRVLSNPKSADLLRSTLNRKLLKDYPSLVQNQVWQLVLESSTNSASEQEIYSKLNRDLKTLFNGPYPKSKSGVADRVEKRVEEIVQIHPTAPKKGFLDLGAGPADISELLSKAWKLDSSESFALDIDADWAPRVGVTRLNYADSMTNRIPLASNRLDLVVILMVLHHAEKPDELIREAHRVLAPGGTLIFRDHSADTLEQQAFLDVVDKMLAWVFYDEKYMPMPGNYFPRSEWQAKMEAAGFEIVSPSLYFEPDHPLRPFYLVARKR